MLYKILALFLGSPSLFSLFRAHVFYTQKIEGEREPGKEPHHGLGSHELYCALYHSCDAFWIVITLLTVNKGCVGESFKTFR